jgi:pimeloyl-ACP methyl ester carboxylesterase
MKVLHRSLWTVCVLLSLLLTSCSSAAPSLPPAQATPTTPQSSATAEAMSTQSKYEKMDCPFDTFGNTQILCGQLTVAEDREKDDGPTITLRVAMMKSRAQEPLSNPLIIMAGPYNITRFMGGVGYIFDQALDKRDLIVVDQRGASTSQPDLSCPEFEKAFWDNIELAWNSKPVIDANAEAASACKKRIAGLTSNLGSYTTSAAVQDMEDLRQILKYDKVNVYGMGYGARLAIQWAQKYPDHIRTIMSDSATPPGVDVSVEQVKQVNRVLQNLFQACAGNKQCAAAYPDLERVFTRVVEDLNAHPEKVVVNYLQEGKHYNFNVNGDQLIDLVISVLSISNPDRLAQLPQMIYQAQEKKYTILATMLADYIDYMLPSGSAMYQNVVCGEYPGPDSQSKILQEIKNSPAVYASYLTHLADLNKAVCAAWDVKLPSQQTAAPSSPSLIPALMLLGDSDLVPKQQWADQASHLFGHAFFIEFNGIGGVFSSGWSSCSLKIVYAFLDDPSTPPEASCAEKKQSISWITFKQ